MRALNWGVNRRFFKAGRLGTTAPGVGVVSVSMPVTIGHRYTVNKMGLPVAYNTFDALGNFRSKPKNCSCNEFPAAILTEL